MFLPTSDPVGNPPRQGERALGAGVKPPEIPDSRHADQVFLAAGADLLSPCFV